MSLDILLFKKLEVVTLPLVKLQSNVGLMLDTAEILVTVSLEL